MRRIQNWVIACMVLLCVACHSTHELYVSTSFHEPATEGLRFIYSEDGIRWDSIAGTWLKPEIGVQKVMRDPSIVKGPDGTYHLVWTCSWRGDHGFGYSSSKDLINWTEERWIPIMEKEPTTVNVWAPELFYDDEREQFMVVWASCIPGRFPRGIEDERNNHRLYYTVTKDFQTFSDPKVLYDPGFSSIDATLVKRGKNDYVMVLKDNTRPNRNLKIAFANSPLGPYTPASESFTETFVEGPTTAKVGDEYYIYFDVYRKKIFGAMKTRDFIHFSDETTRIHFPQGHKHGTVFQAPKSLVENLIRQSKIHTVNE